MVSAMVILPGGSIGKKYVNLPCDELQYLSLGTYRSECLIVFCSIILQGDRLVHKGCNIHRLVEHRMNLWQDKQYNVLLEEAAHCDQSPRNSCGNATCKDSGKHSVKVFTKLMLEGNIRAAVHWLTEHSGGGILKPTDSIIIIGGTSMTVTDALSLDHPNPQVPSDWTVPSMDNLPFLEDSKIAWVGCFTLAGCFALLWLL